MNKNYKKFILPILLLIVILVFILLIYPKLKKIVDELLIIKPDETLNVFLQEGERRTILEKGKKIVFISEFLQPTFVIRKNKKISDLKIYLDDSGENLIASKFSDAIVKYGQNFIELQLSYTFEPKSHKIIIKYNNANKEVIEEYSFLLILFDNFSVPLYESSFWGLTASASQYNNWETKKGHLVASPLPSEAEEGAKSSLFFIKRLKGDFFIQFDLIPKSNNLSFLAYLFERKLNFVFGNGNNKDVVILQKDVRGNFVFEALKTYHVRLIRNKNIYKVFITDKDIFSDENLLLTYEDKERFKVPFDAFGFTIWKSSGGIEVDNFYTVNEDIGTIFDNYVEENSEENYIIE